MRWPDGVGEGIVFFFYGQPRVGKQRLMPQKQWFKASEMFGWPSSIVLQVGFSTSGTTSLRPCFMTKFIFRTAPMFLERNYLELDKGVVFSSKRIMAHLVYLLRRQPVQIYIRRILVHYGV